MVAALRLTQLKIVFSKKMWNMKKWLVINRLMIISTISGAVIGFLYWYFIGCASGSCAITSSPLNSTLYGGLLGFLFMGSFKPAKKETRNERIE